MKVQTVLDWAVGSDMKQLQVASIADDDPEREENIMTMLGYVNQGLIALYGRYALAQQSRVLTNVVDGASYTMADDYLYPMLAKANDDLETTVGINDEESTLSIFTPAPFQVYVGIDKDIWESVTEITVTYAALPAFVTHPNDTLLLPYQLVEPLIKYMAYKGFSSMASANNDDEEDKYFQRYDIACKRAELDGSAFMDNTSNWKAIERGYP